MSAQSLVRRHWERTADDGLCVTTALTLFPPAWNVGVSCRTVKGRPPEEYPSFPTPLVVADKVRHWSSGVWGKPEKASAEKGRQEIGRVCRRSVDVLDAMSTER